MSCTLNEWRATRANPWIRRLAPDIEHERLLPTGSSDTPAATFLGDLAAFGLL